MSELRALGLLCLMALVMGLLAGIMLGRTLMPRTVTVTETVMVPIEAGPDPCHLAVHRSWEAFTIGDEAGYYAAMDDVVEECLSEYIGE